MKSGLVEFEDVSLVILTVRTVLQFLCGDVRAPIMNASTQQTKKVKIVFPVSVIYKVQNLVIFYFYFC